MALENRARASSSLWVRLAGLTGLLVLAIGLVVVGTTGERAGLYLAIIGGMVALVAALVEVKAVVGLVLSRRGALGSNVLAQVALAAVLLTGVNAFSFFHYVRLDWTREHEFTLDASTREQLGQLRGETRLVVLQRHSSFGQLAGKQDNYDAAAERKIVEKVKDLAEQFHELGPRFRVELLDTQEEGFQDRLAALKGQAPALAEAIEAAPENTIFFYSDGKVQRLAFHDVYHLDKKASREDNGGRGNLVLRFQGVGPFARKVLNLDERRPRIAAGVIHEVLGLDSDEDIGMAGAKKALAARGFETRDVILKQWKRGTGPEPAALTRDEFKYERLELTLNQLDGSIKVLGEKEKELGTFREEWSSKKAAELAKKYAIVATVAGPQIWKQSAVQETAKKIGRPPRTVPITEQTRKQIVEDLDENLSDLRETLTQYRQRRADAAREQGSLNVEGLAEQRRLSDVRAKLDRMLADCDLLLLPRMTIFNAARRQRIENWYYRLDGDQAEAIKAFLKRGRPVLFCLGPSNEPPPSPFERPPPPGADRLQPLVEELGFKLPRQTILYNVESESLAEQQAGLIILGPQVEVPPLRFDLPTDRKGNPIRTSLALVAHGAGKQDALEVRLRNPRPVYYAPTDDVRPDPSAVFLRTGKDAWNEKDPFPTEERTPKFEPTKPDDPARGTLEEERRGPFPVACAVQTRLPEAWSAGKDALAGPVRVAVIGHGGIFMGPTLSPAKEKILLDCSNWLLGRDDLLARDDLAPWKYPRVELSDADNALWQWGARLGMPVLFMYLGLMVLLVRRMR